MIDNIKPLGAAVLIEMLPHEKVRASGIIVPESGKEIICRGKVISRGARAYSEIQPGQVVAFTNSPLTEIRTAGPEDLNPRVLIDSRDILYIEGAP